MIIHFLKPGEMLTACGESTAGSAQLAVTEKKRDVNCQLCRLQLT